MTNSPLRVDDGVPTINPPRAAQSTTPRSLGARALRENPTRTAWVIMVIAFVTFCVLAVTIPLLIHSYILYATVARPCP